MHLHIAIYLTDLNIRRMNNIETPVENISRKKLTAQKTSLHSALRTQSDEILYKSLTLCTCI